MSEIFFIVGSPQGSSFLTVSIVARVGHLAFRHRTVEMKHWFQPPLGGEALPGPVRGKRLWVPGQEVREAGGVALTSQT